MQTPKTQLQKSKFAGFTSIELIYSVALIAIISSLAAPSYTSLILNHRKTTSLDAFRHSVILARTESNKRFEHVSLCPSKDGESCTKDRDYSFGWITFINRDKDYPVTRDSNEELIQSIHLDMSGFKLISNRKAYTFRPTAKRNTNGTLMFCPQKYLLKNLEYQAVILSYTGRPRVDKSPKPAHLKICG